MSLGGGTSELEKRKELCNTLGKANKAQMQQIQQLTAELNECKGELETLRKGGAAAGGSKKAASLSGSSVGGASSAADGGAPLIAQLKQQLKESKAREQKAQDELAFATVLVKTVATEATEEIERRKLLLAQERLQFTTQGGRVESAPMVPPSITTPTLGSTVVVGPPSPTTPSTSGTGAVSQDAIQAMVHAAVQQAIQITLPKQMETLSDRLGQRIDSAVGRAHSQSPIRMSYGGATSEYVSPRPPATAPPAVAGGGGGQHAGAKSADFHKNQVQGVLPTPADPGRGRKAQQPGPGDAEVVGQKRGRTPKGTEPTATATVGPVKDESRPIARRRLEGGAEQNRTERRDANRNDATKNKFGADVIAGFILLRSQKENPETISRLEMELKDCVRRQLAATGGGHGAADVEITLAARLVEWIAQGCSLPATIDPSVTPDVGIFYFETLQLWSHFVNQVTNCILSAIGCPQPGSSVRCEVDACLDIVEVLGAWAVQSRGRQAYQSIFVVMYDCILTALLHQSKNSNADRFEGGETLVRLLAQLVAPLAANAWSMRPMQAAASSGLLSMGVHSALITLLGEEAPGGDAIPTPETPTPDSDWRKLCSFLCWNPSPLPSEKQGQLWTQCLDTINTRLSDSDPLVAQAKGPGMHLVSNDTLEAIQCARLLRLLKTTGSETVDTRSALDTLKSALERSQSPHGSESPRQEPHSALLEEQLITFFSFLLLDSGAEGEGGFNTQATLITQFKSELIAFHDLERRPSTAHCHLANSLISVHKRLALQSASSLEGRPADELTRVTKAAQKWWNKHATQLQAPQSVVGFVNTIERALEVL